MDLREQLAALFLGNAPHEETIGATTVEIPFYHRVAFSQPDYALREDVIFQVAPDLGDPCIGTSLSKWEWLCEVSKMLNSAHNPGRAPRMECRRDR